MKLVHKIGAIVAAALLVVSMAGCELAGTVSDWLSAPYGYVKTADGAGIKDATVTITKDGKTVQSAATTTSDGYFSLGNKVDTKGGTYTVTVTAPASSTLTFDAVTITVPDTGYLFSIGTIKPKAVAVTYSISGKLINVRTLAQTALPVAGTVEVRKFGATTVLGTATVSATSTYSITGLSSGDYVLTYKGVTGATTAWVGIPLTLTVTTASVTDFGALVYTGVPTNQMLLVMTWDNKAYDMDLKGMYGTIGDFTTVGAPVTTTGDSVAIWERDVVASASSTYANADKTNVIANGAYTSETVLVKALSATQELRVYARAWISTASPIGSVSGVEGNTDTTKNFAPSGVKMYAMYNGEHFGTWYSPLNTDEKIVGMVRIIGSSDGSLTIGSFGGNFTAAAPAATVRSINTGVEVQAIR